MDCREAIISDETYDYIADYPIENTKGDFGPVVCYEKIDDLFNIVYLRKDQIPGVESNIYDYRSIPKLYGLMSPEAAAPQSNNENPQPTEFSNTPFSPLPLIASGITDIQGSPLRLTGRGTCICIIDTGINYENPLFLDALGRTRIEAIWDQTDQSGRPPDGFLYGSLYTSEEINLALQSQSPKEIVPVRDEIGHGTDLASVAAASGQSPAPDARLVVVKLKPAKEYLRSYYCLPPGRIAYQENDIMLALQFCDRFVRLFSRPIIICLGVGTNAGDHDGNSPLAKYLSILATRRNRGVVVCGGNEGNASHHFRGNLLDPIQSFSNGGKNRYVDVELLISENTEALYLELWGTRPDVLSISIRTPGGEGIPSIQPSIRGKFTVGFVYEKTRITVDMTMVEAISGQQVITFRMLEPTPGIWTFRVSDIGDPLSGIFDMWLPIQEFIPQSCYFLTPSSQVTLTAPSYSREVITVTAYQVEGGAFYVDSGRGFSRSGEIKPDICAPGVNLSTASGLRSGTSYAAALTAGAMAQFMQWAVVNGNDLNVDSRQLKSYLIRGATRQSGVQYPDRELGYGKLNMTGVFEVLRRRGGEP